MGEAVLDLLKIKQQRAFIGAGADDGDGHSDSDGKARWWSAHI